MRELLPERSANGVDISDDLEKDINIDVDLSNNSNSFIKYHSRININYYNFERAEAMQRDGPAKPGLRRLTVSLPETVIAALARLAASTGTTFDELATMAFESLLGDFGVAVGEGESGPGPSRAHVAARLLTVLRAIAERKSGGPEPAKRDDATSARKTPRRGRARRRQ